MRFIVPLRARALAPACLAAAASLCSTVIAPAHAQEDGRLSLTAQDSTAPFTSAREPDGALTLAAAINLALAHSPDLAVASREYEATEGNLIQGRARPNPQAGYVQEGVDSTGRDNSRVTTLQISQPIELGGKRQARIDAAQKLRESANADLVTRRNEIRAQATGLFFEVLAAQERVRLARDSVALAGRATDATSRRVTAGRTSPVEETRARVAQAGAQLELVQAGSELNTARQKLAALWGSRLPHFERADGRVDALPGLPAAADLQGRMERSPHLRRAQIEVERRKALTEVERARRVPDVTFTVGARRPEELGRNQLMLGVSIPIPILDTNRGNIYEAARREDKARDELLATRVRLNAEVLQARERLASSSGELDLLQNTVLPGALSAYEAATTGFELGKFQFLDVLDAQRTLFQAKGQYLRTLAEAHRAAAEIDRLLGDAPNAEEKQP
jgi:cobalt-zinc-cadmium efflux system outer membrane protein